MLPRCSAAFRAAERCCSTTPIAPANGWWARVGGGSIPTSTSACCRRGKARCSASAADSADDRLAQAPVETNRYAGEQKGDDKPPRTDDRQQPKANTRQHAAAQRPRPQTNHHERHGKRRHNIETWPDAPKSTRQSPPPH